MCIITLNLTLKGYFILIRKQTSQVTEIPQDVTTSGAGQNFMTLSGCVLYKSSPYLN